MPKQVLDTAVDPKAIGQQSFDLARRGFDQEQVQQYLRAIADSLGDAQQRESDMRSRLGKAVGRAEKAEQALRDSATPDAAELHRHLGDEVTLVLDAANDAAKERLGAADTTAQEVITAAEARAADIVGEGQVESKEVMKKARVEADAMLQSATARIEQTRNECDELIREAEEARGQILEDMERRRRQARAQVERLRVGRDRLLRSYEAVRRTLDETTGDLKSSLKEAKVRGDSAARAIIAEPLASREQLEVELADAKLIGRVKISKPSLPLDAKPTRSKPRSPALPRAIDPTSPKAKGVADGSAPTPRKPELVDTKPSVSKKRGAPAQPKAPAVAPTLSASPPADVKAAADDGQDLDDAAIADELAQLEDDELNVVEPADEIERVTALPAIESGSELFALLRIQSSKTGKKSSTTAKKTAKPKTRKAKTPKAKTPKAKSPKAKTGSTTTGKAAAPLVERAKKTPVKLPAGLDAQRDAVIADAAKQLEKRLKRALADEQNDLLATIGAAKKKDVALTAVVGDLDTHLQRYVVAINEVAVVTYGAGAALIDAEAVHGQLPAGAVEELLEADLVLPIRERLQSLDALAVDRADSHADPVRAFYRQRKTDHVSFAASRLAQLLCVAGLHDAQP